MDVSLDPDVVKTCVNLNLKKNGKTSRYFLIANSRMGGGKDKYLPVVPTDFCCSKER